MRPLLLVVFWLFVVTLEGAEVLNEDSDVKEEDKRPFHLNINIPDIFFLRLSNDKKDDKNDGKFSLDIGVLPGLKKKEEEKHDEKDNENDS